MLNRGYLERLKRVEPYLELWRDDRRFVELRAGLYATLYFKHVHPMVDKNEAIREALINCSKDYWQLVGEEHRRWGYKFGGSVTGHKLPSARVPSIETLLQDPEHFGRYQHYVHGGKHEDDSSDYLFDVAAFPIYGAPDIAEGVGFLRLQAPFDYVEGGQLNDFVGMVKRCAQRLQVDQGHGGLGFLRTYNAETTTRNAESQLSKVFSGVDIDVPYVQMAGIYHLERGHLGIDSPHWLNFLSDRWVGKLGGVDAIRAQLPDETFTVEPYEGGLFVQAGEYPEPGHKTDGLPPPYVWLNRVFKPIRAPTMVYCMGDEPGQLAQNHGARQYFTRFDAASEKLPPWPASNDGLQHQARQQTTGGGVPANLTLRCESGQPCPRAGYWFSPGSLNSRRQFQHAELMPDLGAAYGVTIWQWDQRQ